MKAKKQKSNNDKKEALKRILYEIYKKVFRVLNYYKLTIKIQEKIIKYIRDYLVYIISENVIPKKAFNINCIHKFSNKYYEDLIDKRNSYLILKKFIKFL